LVLTHGQGFDFRPADGHRLTEAGSGPGPPVNKWVVTLSVTFGTLMGTIDASIVNVAGWSLLDLGQQMVSAIRS
jgi:hypothetical protein